MRIWYKFFWVLAWATEAVGGLFFPLLLLFASLAVPTNENNRLVDIPGFPLVLIALGVATASMLCGMILYLRKRRKVGWILLIVGAALFAAGAFGIRICCMPASGATSLKVTGEYRLTGYKLAARHLLPILVPLWVLLAAICRQRVESQELMAEALEEMDKDGSTTLSLKHERDRRDH